MSFNDIAITSEERQPSLLLDCHFKAEDIHQA